MSNKIYKYDVEYAIAGFSKGPASAREAYYLCWDFLKQEGQIVVHNFIDFDEMEMQELVDYTANFLNGWKLMELRSSDRLVQV